MRVAKRAGRPPRLSRSMLDELPAAIGGPPYDARDLTAGIVHFGVGNFHRAHQGVYLDRLFARGLGREWAVVGAGVMPGDEMARRTLAAQDYLTLVVTRSATSDEARITAPMVGFLPIGDRDAILTQLSDPAIRIVSLTVTEGGYFQTGEGQFDAANAAILADATAPANPRTVFGLIVAALARRRRDGTAPFTVMSCDNLPHNGEVARAVVTGLARLIDPELATWIDTGVAFPNAMVDRITPATTDRERRLARERYGVDDVVPVFAEDFIQWVIEDRFCAGRPPLEHVGVTFVDDVTPYEMMKLRVLNASHAIIAYPAALLGVDYVHDAVAHPLIAPLLDRIQFDEVIPAVAAVPDMTPAAYFATVRSRFANPHIADTTARLCFDGINRQPKFIVPAIRAALALSLPVDGLALASALWCRYCLLTRDDGTPIASDDPAAQRLVAVAQIARGDPACWLDQHDIYGAVGAEPRLRESFAKALTDLHRDGVAMTLSRFATTPPADRRR